jgi:hypothetical protein
MVDGELLACGRTAQLVAAAFEPPPLLDPELPEPGFEPFAFGVALGFASALGFAELPESLDLPSPAGLLAELTESAEPEPESDELEPEPESDEDEEEDPDPPASTRAFESLRLSVR